MSLKRLQKVQLNILDKIGQVEKLIGKEGDNLTRGLEIQLLNNNIIVDDISTINCMLIAKQKGAEAEDTFVVPGAKVNNKYEIIYPSNLMKSGIVEAELRFTQGDKILSSFIFEIDMARTLVVEEITDSIYEQRLIDVIVDVVANEDVRIENEETRESNESERLSSESERLSNEVTRKSNEVTRQSNEDIREVFETARVTDELTRELNENTRKSNEVDRVNAENSRVTAETDRDNKYTQIEQDYQDRAETLEETYAPRLTSAEQDIQENYQELQTHLAENVSQGNPHGIDAKANKAQANWISGTLQNGWTGEFKYRKNDLNIVSLVFESVRAGTTTPITIVASLPSGYRPRRNAAIQLTTSSGVVDKKILYVNENGNIYIAVYSTFTADPHSGVILLEAEVI